jgi:predicted dehydrogenase
MILSIVGNDPKTVITESSCILQPNISDTATIHLEFENLKAHISVSWLHPHKEQKLVVIGNNAMVVFDDTMPWNKKLAIYRHKVKFSETPPKLDKADLEYLEVPEDEPLKNECMHFLDVVNNNKEPITDGREGLCVLNILTAASVSEAKKEKVKLEIND